jgi:hypothetical protein
MEGKVRIFTLHCALLPPTRDRLLRLQARMDAGTYVEVVRAALRALERELDEADAARALASSIVDNGCPNIAPRNDVNA